jgi:hypothetical protein
MFDRTMPSVRLISKLGVRKFGLLPDLAPPDRTRSDVCYAAAFMSISAWA